jgi:recombination protein RecT
MQCAFLRKRRMPLQHERLEKMATNLQELQQGKAPAKQERTLLDLLADPKVKDGFSKVIGNAMTPARMVQLCIVAARKTPKLLECEPASVLGAMMAAAALGLEPNTPQGQAYLIPYGKRAKNPQTGKWEVASYECQFQIGYRGYITLAYRSPHIDYLQADCIHENDHFVHKLGSTSLFEFEKKLTNRGRPIGAFCFVKFKNGAEAALVLPLDEIEKIRECSDTFTSLRGEVDSAEAGYKRKKAEEKFADTPWVKWFDDMATKSVIKKMCKQLPMEQGAALAAATDLEGGDGRIIDMASMVDPEKVMAVVSGESYAPEVEPVAGIEYMEADTLPIDIAPQREAEPVRQEPQSRPAEKLVEAASGPALDELMKRLFGANTEADVNAIVSAGAHLSDGELSALRNRGLRKIEELSTSGPMSLE